MNELNEMSMPQGVMRVNSASATMPMHMRMITPGSEVLQSVTPFGGDGAALPETATSVPLPMSQDESPMMAEVADDEHGDEEQEDGQYNEIYGAGVTPGDAENVPVTDGGDS